MPISGSWRGSGNASAHCESRPLWMANNTNSSVSSSLAVSRWTSSPNSIACRTASPLRAQSLMVSMVHLLSRPRIPWSGFCQPFRNGEAKSNALALWSMPCHRRTTMTQTTPVQDTYTRFSCPNPQCRQFNRPGAGHIAHRSWTGKHKHIERLRCTVCTQEFSERAGTLMARSKLPEETVERLLKCQRWGVCDEGTADICAVALKTVHRFQRVATHRAYTHHQQAVQHVEVKGVQM